MTTSEICRAELPLFRALKLPTHIDMNRMQLKNMISYILGFIPDFPRHQKYWSYLLISGKTRTDLEIYDNIHYCNLVITLAVSALV